MQDVEHAVLCCAAPWQWYPLRHHLSSADQAACTSGADLLPRLSSPQVQCPGDVCLFALDTEKLSGRQLLLLLSQAEGKPSSSSVPEQGGGVPFHESPGSVVLIWHAGTYLPKNLSGGGVQGGILFSRRAPS